MQGTGAPWSPRLSDIVLVKATGEGGEVVDIIGADAERRFVVAIAAVRSPGEPAAAPAVERRPCRLDELAPARRA